MKNFVLARTGDLTMREREQYREPGFFYLEMADHFIAAEAFEDDGIEVLENERYLLMLIGRVLRLKNSGAILVKDRLQEYWNDSADFARSIFDSLNGICAVVLADKTDGKVRLISDPMGFFPWMIWRDGDDIIISDHLQYIVQHRRTRLEWDEAALRMYYRNGHFVSGRSWFRALSRSLPGRIIEVDVKKRSILQNIYHRWSEHDAVPQDDDGIIERYNGIFSDFFGQVPEHDFPWGVALSGGLDSRRVLYELSLKSARTRAFTFGEIHTPDVRIAEQVCKALGVDWHFFELKKKDWLHDRLQCIWMTGGLLPVQHFHEGPIYGELQKRYGIIATGFYGGGVYSLRSEAGKKMDHRMARRRFDFEDADDLTDDPCFDTPHIDPYMAFQRIANSGALHMHFLGKYSRLSLPFCHQPWLRFNYSVPDSMQLHHRLYLDAVNRRWPEALRRIPWQKTLLPVSWSAANRGMLSSGIFRLEEPLMRLFGRQKSFVDYHCTEDEADAILREWKGAWHPPEPPATIEHKLRALTIVLWMEMCRQNRHDVL